MTWLRNGLLVFDSLDRGGKLIYFNSLFDVIRFASMAKWTFIAWMRYFGLVRFAYV